MDCNSLDEANTCLAFGIGGVMGVMVLLLIFSSAGSSGYMFQAKQVDLDTIQITNIKGTGPDATLMVLEVGGCQQVINLYNKGDCIEVRLPKNEQCREVAIHIAYQNGRIETPLKQAFFYGAEPADPTSKHTYWQILMEQRG